MNYRNEGFTLLELMVVVAVLAIIVVIAIPSMMSARIAANEASAISSLRTLLHASEVYRTRNGTFPTQLSDFSASQMLDEVLVAATVAPGKHGYLFNYTGGVGSWSAEANPLNPGNSGQRYFFIDTSGVIRYSELTNANSSDAPVE